MNQQVTYHSATTNPHTIALVLKEIARRAIQLIKLERFQTDYQIDSKKVNYKSDEDFVTSADKKAQDLYLKMLTENFPGYGIMGEENNLMIPCTIPGQDLCFFIDPLDGTKAYIRKQSHATSTMLALCDIQKGEYLMCIIGDINTGEIYYFKPDSKKVYRVTDFNEYELLNVTKKPLNEQYLLVREDIRNYSSYIQEITCPNNKSKLFKNIEIEGGSIGTMMMRLVKGEVGAVALQPGQTTPWDANPVNGFLQKMGFIILEKAKEATHYYKVSLGPILEQTEYYERIIVHNSFAKEFNI